jgi:hypothetical protein
MRYIVRVVKKDGSVKDIYSSDDYSSARAVEKTALQIYGYNNVWICDVLQEIMVG